jgi:hypothetical protein
MWITQLGAAVLEDSEGSHQRVVKLRDPWSKEVWPGGSNSPSRDFWSKILATYERKEF